ncbi:GLPGLI family protein [Polaribacter sp.]|uniref:GLPGLI family protein n=1 Tax=Polaribacter sp. TaxID=1920175 RepID=UPI004047D11E
MKYLLPFLILCALEIQSQSVFYDYKFTFLVKEQTDLSATPNIIVENMVLFVGKSKSLYISPTKLKVDSARIEIKKNGGSFYELSDYKATLPSNKISNFLEKNHIEKNIKIFYVIPNFEPYYVESDPKFEWKITNEKKKILNYTCQKAIVRYKGRDFVAWFSPEIPLQNGPWKFGGLPGFIFEISDTKNHYSFKLIGIKKEHRLFPKSNIKSQQTTKEGISRVFENYMKNIENRLMGESKERFKKERLSRNTNSKNTKINPIELEN